MKNLPNLPPDVDERLGELAERILEAREAGDFRQVLELAEASWEQLPEPKLNWNFEPQAIAFGAVEDVALAAQPDLGAGLDIWISRMYRAYFDEKKSNLLLRMAEGDALHAVGRLSEATETFQFVYDTEGAKWFRDKYKPYLSLVKR